MLADHHLAEMLDPARVLADQQRAEVLDAAHDGARLPFDGRLAPADQPLVGLHLDEYPVAHLSADDDRREAGDPHLERSSLPRYAAAGLNDQEATEGGLRAGYVAFGSSLYDGGRLAGSPRGPSESCPTRGSSSCAPIPSPRTTTFRARSASCPARRGISSIANVVNWVEYRAATRVLLAFRDRPTVLYSYGGFTEGGTLISPAAGAGSTALRFPLERWGVRFAYLFNGPDEPMDVSGVVRFGRAARAARRMRTARVGLFGWGDMGLYTTAFDVTRLRGQLGPEVESVDLLEVERTMSSIPAEEVTAAIARQTEAWEWPHGRPGDEGLDQAFRLYLATVAICREHAFDAVSYKCVEGVASVLGVLHSLPSSLVATDGYPYVDENDVGNLVAELALKWISDQPVTFLEHYEHYRDSILLGVDGFVPHQMVDGPVVIKRTDLLSSEGLAHGSRMKTGRMTLACLAQTGDGYRMHIVTGDAREPTTWVEMGTELPPWPSVRFFPTRRSARFSTTCCPSTSRRPTEIGPRSSCTSAACSTSRLSSTARSSIQGNSSRSPRNSSSTRPDGRRPPPRRACGYGW